MRRSKREGGWEVAAEGKGEVGGSRRKKKNKQEGEKENVLGIGKRIVTHSCHYLARKFLTSFM